LAGLARPGVRRLGVANELLTIVGVADGHRAPSTVTATIISIIIN
jgi:hypothetical protein